MSRHEIEPTVFISCNQDSADALANQVENHLKSVEKVLRNKSSIAVWGSIIDFMKQILKQDMVVMLVTEKYLQSTGALRYPRP